MRRVLKPLRSFVNLSRIVAAQTWRVGAALFRGDAELAGAHVRSLLLALLDDACQALVQAQRLICRRTLRSENVDRILIIKLDRLGDMVTGSPVIDALRERFPRARIDIVGHPLPLALFEGDDRVAERIEYRSWLYHAMPMRPSGPRTIGLVLRLLARRYSLVVVLRGSFSFLPLGLFSRMTATKFVTGEPVVRRNLRSLESQLGPVPDRTPVLRVTEEGRRFVHDQLNRTDDPRPWVAIQPASNAKERMWPHERFAAVADALVEKYGAAVHFLGSAADEPMMRSIHRGARHEHGYHTSLSLQKAVALIEAADILIGNDSALAHIAAAVGTPVVVIWGAANLTMSCPKAKPDLLRVLYNDVACRPTCLEFRCTNPDGYQCLLQTQVADVLSAAGDLLSRRHSMRAQRIGSPTT